MDVDRRLAQAQSECPNCKQSLQANENGSCRCSCGTMWVSNHPLGVAGNSDEEAALAQLGFHRATDITGDVYYHLPTGGHIVHLFPDGTWYSEKAAQGSSLKNYLTWLEASPC